jgi:phosphatidate cytidylyltransferase
MTVPGQQRMPVSVRTVLARGASYAALGLALAAAVALGAPGIAALVAALAAIGLWEWANICALPIHHRVGLLVADGVMVVALLALGLEAAPWLIGALVLTGMLWPVVRANPDRAIRDLGFAAVGFVSIAVMLGHGVVLAHDSGWAGVLLFASLAVGCAGSDVGAFLAGRRFGHTLLSPTLSPAKTRAGLVGNVIGAALALLPFVPFLLAALGPAAWSTWYVALLVPIVAFGSVWGDLFESAVKREVGVKDAGHWLPGFGGLLDRVDSLLITLPLAYWTLRLFEVTVA